MEIGTHILDSEGELCTECGLFEEFFVDIPDCPSLDEGDEEDEGIVDEEETESTLG